MDTSTEHKVIASMIAWLDAHQGDGMDSGIWAEIKREDPRTWREVYDAGLVTDDDVTQAWLLNQAPRAVQVTTGYAGRPVGHCFRCRHALHWMAASNPADASWQHDKLSDVMSCPCVGSAINCEPAGGESSDVPELESWDAPGQAFGS